MGRCDSSSTASREPSRGIKGVGRVNTLEIRVGLQGEDDVSLVEKVITVPIAFRPHRRLASQVLRRLQHLNQVKLVELAITICIAWLRRERLT